VSLILDALRRKSAERRIGDDEEQRAADVVPAALGYPRPIIRSPLLPLRTFIAYGGVAMLIGFLSVLIAVVWLTPPARNSRGTRAAPVPAPQTGRESGPASPPPALQGPAPPVSLPVPNGGLTTSGPPIAPEGAGLTRTAPAVPPDAPPQAGTVSPAIPALPAASAPVQAAPARGASPPTSTSAAEAVPPPGLPKAAPPQTEAAARQAASASGDPFGLALYYQRVGDYTRSMAQYRALLEENEASVEVHNNVGLLYQDRGELDEAVRQFQRAIAIDPKYVKAHNNLGVAQLRLNRLEAAEAEFRIVLATEPRNVESLVNLALVQKATGRPAEARELLQRAIAIDPRNPGPHYNLGVLADDSGDTATAVEHYRVFLRLGAGTESLLVTQVRARLAALGG